MWAAIIEIDAPELIKIHGGEGAIRTLEGEAPTDLQSASFSHLVTSPEN